MLRHAKGRHLFDALIVVCVSTAVPWYHYGDARVEGLLLCVVIARTPVLHCYCSAVLSCWHHNHTHLCCAPPDSSFSESQLTPVFLYGTAVMMTEIHTHGNNKSLSNGNGLPRLCNVTAFNGPPASHARFETLPLRPRQSCTKSFGRVQGAMCGFRLMPWSTQQTPDSQRRFTKETLGPSPAAAIPAT